ncbi:hypothetical protein CRYUN_Cryun36dG0096100 [Craigia yunnanensis]
MMAFSMRNIAVFIALFHASVVVATVPSCQTCGSPNLSHLVPEAASPELAPIPPADSPETNKAEFLMSLIMAFSAAWNAACDHPGNSTFYIPEGTFLVGPISFPGPCYNNRSPNIEIRGTLLAPISLSAFQSSNWIAFKNLQGFTLTGGTETAKLDGQGAAEARKQSSCEKSERCKKLIISLDFFNVSHATISSITLSNSKGFHLGLHAATTSISTMSILLLLRIAQTLMASMSVTPLNINITSSTTGVGDDCVSIGPGSNNISVSNVQCGSGHGISVGSLGKYKKEKNVVGISCTIKGTQNGIRMKTWAGAPESNASNMTFEDIFMISVSNPSPIP